MVRPQYLAALVLIAVCSPAVAGEQIPLQDDRGKRLVTPVRACFQLALHEECGIVQAGASIDLLPDFASLRVEGDDYGPTALPRHAVVALVGRGEPLRLVRKASVIVGGGAPQSLSLYRLDDAEVGRPTHRVNAGLDKIMKLPAGEFIASLWRMGNAPDLYLLDLKPGGVRRLYFKQKEGWSLVLRVEDPESGRPIPGALVALQPMAGYSRENKVVRKIQSDSLGLAIFSGLTSPLMEATVDHPKYLATRVPALLASPGTFDFRRVRLEPGSVARAKVIFGGREQRGAICEVVQYIQKPTGKAGPPQRIFSGSTDREGMCETRPLPAGVYVLRVAIPGSPAHAQVGFTHKAGEDTFLSVDVVPSMVSGVVTLGKRPAVGFQIELHSNSAVIPARTAADATAIGRTDDEGHYEATVWSSGEYWVLAATPAGIPAMGKKIQLDPGENLANFELDDAGISGRAVDETGEPIEGAAIAVRWRRDGGGRESRLGRSGADGTFMFPMVDSGDVVVEGVIKGFKSPPPVELRFVAGAQPPDVRLVFTKEAVRRGVLLTASGRPVAGGWVALFTASPETYAPPTALVSTDAEGQFEVPLPKDGSARGFASGPGCPLASFSATASEEDLMVTCPAQPAALSIVIRDENHVPVSDARVVLLKDGAVIPWHALATHLGTLGLPAASDAYGRLTIAALAPGEYRVFLLDATNEELIRSGSDQGYIGSFSLGAMQVSEMEVEIDRRRLPVISGT